MAFNGREKKRAIASNKRVVVLEAEFAEAKAVHARLAGVATLSEANDKDALADLKSSNIHVGDVE